MSEKTPCFGGVEVWQGAILKTPVGTEDHNAEGYLMTNGENREMYFGLTASDSPEWTPLIGDNCGLHALPCDPFEQIVAWFHRLGDVGLDDHSRVEQGVRRLSCALQWFRDLIPVGPWEALDDYCDDQMHTLLPKARVQEVFDSWK